MTVSSPIPRTLNAISWDTNKTLYRTSDDSRLTADDILKMAADIRKQRIPRNARLILQGVRSLRLEWDAPATQTRRRFL